MFYTKYRPQKFEELVGLDSVKRSLLSSLAKRRVGHAYLFCGPRGTGKTSTARLLAKAVNCAKVDDSDWCGEPCGECASCQAIEAGRMLDLIEIDAASNRGIDDIRNLRERIKLAPSQSRKKVYVIDEVHMLTREAFNALLKTLEEPPSHALFILCTTELEKVPETVRSRCQIFEFKRARDTEIAEKLAHICEAEGEALGGAEIREIARAARGGYRDAETILEQVLIGGEKVTDLVGEGRGSYLSDFVSWLMGGDCEKSLTFINHSYSEGKDLSHFNHVLLEYLRDLLLISAGLGEELIASGAEDFLVMKGQADQLGRERIVYLINEFTQSARSLSNSPIPSLPLELAVVDSCHVIGGAVTSGNLGDSVSCLEVRGDAKDHQTDSGACADGRHCPASGGSSRLEDVRERWEEIVAKVRNYNHGLEVLLRSVKPVAFDGGVLCLEAYYSFHQECLSQVKNVILVEKALQEVLVSPVRISCVLGKRPEGFGGHDSWPRTRPGDLEEDALKVFS